MCTKVSKICIGGLLFFALAVTLALPAQSVQANGTLAWVEEATLGGATYDLVVSNWYVATTGLDTNLGTADSPFLTVQHAVDAAAAGDTIHVASGTYAETLSLVGKNNLTIVGAGEGQTILDAGASSGYGWDLRASGTELSDFTFIGPATGTYGIKVSGMEPAPAAGFNIHNVTIQNSNKTGLDVNGVNGVTITDVTVINTVSGAGIALTDVNNATLTYVTTAGNAWGSIAVMTYGRYFPGGSDNVTLTDITSTEPIYTEVDNYSDPASPYPLTNFTASEFLYKWTNLTDKPDYVYYTETESQATTLALRFPHPDKSLVFNLTNCHYIVAPGMSIQTAVDAADPDHPSNIDITAGTHTLGGVLNLNKPLSLHGVDRPLIQVSGSGDRFDISAAGVSMDGLRIEKTDKAGEQNIIRIRASDTNIVDNEIFGHYVFGDPEVSRAMLFNAGDFSGINISGNTIHDLRQPAYVSGTHTGLISNNYVYRTRGWVLEGGDLTFVDNRWGSGANANIFDIAIIPQMPAEYYTDIPTVALSNNGAFIEDQRSSPATLSIVYVDGNAATSGTGTATSPVQSITQGIARVVPNGMIRVAAGTYVENIVINKSLNLAGAWAGSTTIVQPAVSSPNPCTGSSLCGGAASNVILVQAKDVIIHDLIVDGDNPALTSGIVRGGADLDARNGIIKNTDATYDGLEVYNTTVQNIYLRGIYSTGGTFNFYDNTVTNVQGDEYSIGMFAWVGPGSMSGNKVSYANDAISANHSRGIQFVGNTVTHSGSGVHTDNAGDSGGTADLIQGNDVSDCLPEGYGVWTFVPYIAPTVDSNTVTNCEIGLSAWGQGAAVTPQFTNNTVTGPAQAAESVGAYITTDLISWGYSDVSVEFTGNVITGFETGIQLTADQQSWNPYPYEPKTITAAFHLNQIYGNTSAAEKGTNGTSVVDLESNWWGSASGPSGITGLDYTPWCGDGACSFLVQPPEAFNKIDPPNAAAGLATNVLLNWSASTGATRYEYCLGTSAGACTAWIDRGMQTSVSLSGLLPNTTYYWQVRAINSDGTSYADQGVLWTFTTSRLPGAFNKIYPANGTTGLATSIALNWSPSTGATRYEYCLATSAETCTSWKKRGTQTSVPVSGLLPDTTYYWQVRATNSYGTTYADSATIWSFRTAGAPAAFGKTVPLNGATGVGTKVVLQWGTSAGATRYEYCLSTSAVTCTTWVNRGAQTSVSVSRLLPNTTYYWQVRATNSYGTTYADSTALWSFTTKP